MDKLAKIIDLINAALIKLGDAMFVIWCNLIPAPISNFYHKIIGHKDNLTDKTLSLSAEKFQLLSAKIKAYYDSAKVIKAKVSEFDFKEIMKVKVMNFRILIKTHSVRDLIKMFIANYIKSPLEKIKQFDFSNIKKHYRFVTTGFVFIVVGSTGIYYAGIHIFEKEFLIRAPASVVEYKNNPGYKKFQARTIQIQQIKIPIFIESVREVRAVTISFTIRTSTRFSLYYLDHFEYKLKDYFFTSVDPVTSKFALTVESKEILKEKIIEEVNQFFINERVEGKALEVDIIYILGT